MAIYTSDLTVRKRDTKTWTITVIDSDEAVFSLSGYTIRFSVKEKSSDADGDAVISSTGTITDAAGGVFTIDLTKADTDIAPGTYVYDIQIDNGSSAVEAAEASVSSNLLKGR